jgi:hypothetical protein
MSTTFKIKVNKAILTYDCCSFSTMDPFFMAYFDVRNNPFRSSVCKNGGKYPSWSESFNLQFKGERCLTIEVFHENESLGKIEFDVKDCVNNTFEMDIEQPLAKMGKQTGTISFTLTAQKESGFSGGINFGNGNNVNNQINNNSTGFSNFNPNQTIQNNNGNNFNNPNPGFTPGFNSNINNTNNFNNTNNQVNTGGQNQNSGSNANFNNGTNFQNFNNVNNLNNQNNQNFDINYGGQYGINNLNNYGNNTTNNQGQFNIGLNNQIGMNNDVQFSHNGQSVPMMNNFSQPINNFEGNYQNNSNYPNFNNNNNSNFSYNNTNFGGSGINSKSLHYFKNPIYFQDSSRKIHRLDLNTGNWENVNNNTQEFFNRHHRAAELPDGSYLITGGEYNNQPSNNCTLFSNGYFARKDKMNVLRKAHSSIYMNGFVYVFGGFSNGGITKSCERYCFNQNNWQNTSNMIIPRAYTTPVVYGDNYIYLVGGMINSYNGVI